jgi:hypothetical protein
MPKDYQEVERIVEEFLKIPYHETSRQVDWLRNTLITLCDKSYKEGYEKGEQDTVDQLSDAVGNLQKSTDKLLAKLPPLK